MANKRKRHTAAFQAQVALAAVRGGKTVTELASPYGTHPTSVHGWNKQLLAGADQVFRNGSQAAGVDAAAEQAALVAPIGRLQMELEWLPKKGSGHAPERRRPRIEAAHPASRVRRQCALRGLVRSGLYYEPAPQTAENLRLRRLIDAKDTAHPFYGSRRLTAWRGEPGEAVHRQRVQRLLRLVGLGAIDPRPKLSAAGRGHRAYP